MFYQPQESGVANPATTDSCDIGVGDPEASPFALLNQRQAQPSNDPLNGMVSLFEGRAAFTQGAADNSALTTERHLHGRNFQ